MNTITESTEKGLSVVIATLGGAWLSKTIDSLMSGSVKPDEILICIPEAYAVHAEPFASAIVKVVATEVKGQVRQRAYGFTQVKYGWVLQLDDDILLEHDTLSNLIVQLEQLGRKNVVSPVYYATGSRTCIHSLATGYRAFWKNLFDYIICAAPWGRAKMGVVTRIGINYGVDDRFCEGELKETDWVPGGCVLSFREDLIKNDFFPFEGKAYCEDLYHSLYRRKAGIRLWVAPRIKVYIDQPEFEFSKNAVEKVIAIRRYYLNLIKGPQWRLIFYEIFCRLRSRFYSQQAKA